MKIHAKKQNSIQITTFDHGNIYYGTPKNSPYCVHTEIYNVDQNASTKTFSFNISILMPDLPHT